LSLFRPADSKLTQKEIREKTKLSPRAVKYSLKALERLGLILAMPCFSDTRRKVYAIKARGGGNGRQ
jgi:DNA-binding MarR family transcriptional regulator